jgi:hypothetical protein
MSGQPHALAALPQKKKLRTDLDDVEKRKSCTAWNQTGTVQPVASRYTGPDLAAVPLLKNRDGGTVVRIWITDEEFTCDAWAPVVMGHTFCLLHH